MGVDVDPDRPPGRLARRDVTRAQGLLRDLSPASTGLSWRTAFSSSISRAAGFLGQLITATIGAVVLLMIWHGIGG